MAVQRHETPEQRLVERIAREPQARPHDRGGRLVLAIAGVCLVLLALLAAAVLGAAWRQGLLFVDPEQAAIQKMALGLFMPLRSGALELALQVCAEGDEASARLAEDELRVFGAAGRPEQWMGPSLDEARARRIAELAQLRSALTEMGADWSEARLVAFGAMKAAVYDPAIMLEPAVALTGDLYFETPAGLYAIELSARECGGGYIIVELWDAKRVDLPSDGLETYSLQHVESLISAASTESDAPFLSGYTHVFMRL